MIRLLVIPVVSLALLALPGAAAACAACACGDPTMTVMGTGKSFGGRLRLSTEWRRRAETTPGAHGPTRIVEDRFAAGISWAPIDAVQLGLTLPLVQRTVDTATLARDRVLHVGDVDLLARWFIFGARGRATHQLGLTAGLRLPTGPEVSGADGRPLPLDGQPGTGGYLPSLGAWYGLFAHPWSLHLALSGVTATAGHGGFAPGAAALGTAMGQYQWGTAVALRAGLDGRWTARDTVDGQTVHGSGGPTLFAAGGAVAGVTEDMLAHAMLRWPVLDERRSGERAAPSVSLGLTLDL